MPSDSAKPTPQFLNAPGDVYQPTGGPAVTRYPLVYTPLSATQLNYPRLPPLHQLSGMDLCYREQLLSDAQISENASHLAWSLVLTGAIGVLALLIFGPFIDPMYIISFGLSIAIVTFAIMVARGRTVSPTTVQRAFLGVSLLALLLPALSVVSQQRELAAVLFAGITAAGFFSFGRSPFDFYQAWLTAHPRLRPETRANIQKKRIVPSYAVLAGIFVLVIAGPLFSQTLTLALLTVIGFALGASPSVVRTAYRVLGQYISYGQLTTNAPGVWRPAESIQRRRRNVVALTLPFYLTLASGLTVYFPVDVLHRVYPEYLSNWDLVVAAFQRQALGLALVIPFAVAYSLIVPTLLLFAVFRRAVKALEKLRLEIEGETDSTGSVHGGLDDDGRTEWQWYVDRLSTSPHKATDPLDPFGDPIREADHLFLGVEPNFKFPVLLDRRILSEHCYIVGETGSGKTSLGIIPIALQLLRGSKPRDKESASPRPALIILDLKGDPALFHTLKEECGDEIPFRFFTPQPGRATHYFNAFRELRSEQRSIIQLGQLILDSLSLSHGEGYGRSYYSRQSRHALLSVLQAHPQLNSFDELYAALQPLLKSSKREAFELLSTIHALTFYPQLVTVPAPNVPPEHIIHMPRVLEESQVVYFWLPAALESASVREIGKLALYALLTAAIDRQQTGKERKQAYVFIDEFQRLAGDNFRIILEQARSFGLSAILANQTQSDLVMPESDLRPTIRTNTRLKLSFSVTDPAEVRTLIESSGEEIGVMRGWTETASGAGLTATETIKPRLTRNDVLLASDHPLHFIAHVSRGSGYTQFGGMPLPVRSTFPISAMDYKRRSASLWPELAPGLTQGDMPIADIERLRAEEAASEMAAQRAKLEDLLRRKAPKT